MSDAVTTGAPEPAPVDEKTLDWALAAYQAAGAVLDVYAAVASGATRGAGGTFAADGAGTLVAVSVPVELLEELARVVRRRVYGRTKADRDACLEGPG